MENKNYIKEKEKLEGAISKSNEEGYKQLTKELEMHILRLYFGKSGIPDFEKRSDSKKDIRYEWELKKIEDYVIGIENSRKLMKGVLTTLRNRGYDLSKLEWIGYDSKKVDWELVTSWTKDDLKEILKENHSLVNSVIDELLEGYTPQDNKQDNDYKLKPPT